MSQSVNCLFTIHIDEMLGLEVPIHKGENDMNFDVFIKLRVHKLWCP